MKPGFVRCPLCERPTGLISGGRMGLHWVPRDWLEGGFRSLAERCKGSNKRPEDVMGA